MYMLWFPRSHSTSTTNNENVVCKPWVRNEMLHVRIKTLQDEVYTLGGKRNASCKNKNPPR